MVGSLVEHPTVAAPGDRPRWSSPFVEMMIYLHGLGLARLHSPQVLMSWTKSLKVTVTRSVVDRQFGTLIACSLDVSARGALTNETVPAGGSSAGMKTSTPVWNACVGKNGSRSSVESWGDAAASCTWIPMIPLLVTFVRTSNAG